MATILRSFPPARDTAPGKPKAPTMAQAAQQKAVDGVNSFGQIGAVVLTLLGKTDDAFAVTLHSENIARGMVDAAETDPFMAKIVGFCQKGGPYGALLAAVLPLGIQIGINHDRVPETAVKIMPGALYTKEGLRKKAMEAQDEAA